MTENNFYPLYSRMSNVLIYPVCPNDFNPNILQKKLPFSKNFDILFFSLSDSGKDFAVQDISWFSSLEGTKWLSCVSQCLKTACDAAKHLENHTVIIKGKCNPGSQEKQGFANIALAHIHSNGSYITLVHKHSTGS